jgi:anti-sigma-K factor RskA
MSSTHLTPDDIALAGEFALGLLDPAENAAAQARVATDTVFAAEVESWAERLMPMLGSETVMPPPSVWSNIEARTGAHSASVAATGQDNTKGAIGFWKGLSLISTAAALILGVMLMQPAPPAPVQPAPARPLIAALSSETGKASMTASYDAQSGTLTLTPVRMETGKLYPELWVIPAGGAATSLGMINGSAPSQHNLPAPLRALMAQGATLAITPEPIGGAPGGKATGPVLASGTITSI